MLQVGVSLEETDDIVPTEVRVLRIQLVVNRLGEREIVRVVNGPAQFGLIRRLNDLLDAEQLWAPIHAHGHMLALLITRV